MLKSLDETIGLIADLFGQLDSRVSILESKVSAMEQFPLPLPEPVPPTLPAPPPEPVPVPTFPPYVGSYGPDNYNGVTVGSKFLWAYGGINVRSVKEGITITDSDTALLLNQPGVGNGSVYVDCCFLAGRYALWADHQDGLVFVNCIFDDSLRGSDESTVRLEDCKNVLFHNCTIRAHGAKHGFRLHGTSSNVTLSGMVLVNNDGNGIMMGHYQGGGPANVTDVRISGLKAYINGPDVLNIPTDGSITKLSIFDSSIEVGGPGSWWTPPVNNSQLEWFFDNLTKK